MKTRAVLFDLDETLILEEASNDESARIACAIAGARCGLDQGALFRAMRERSVALFRAGPAIDYCRAIGVSPREGLWGSFAGAAPELEVLRQWSPRYRVESWSAALHDLGVDDRALAEELADVFKRDRGARHVVFPESEPVLRALQPDFRLGLITNGAPGIQRVKIRASGLADWFDTILVSGEVGVGKPLKRIFEIALEQLGVAAADAVMVGDSLNRDVKGARDAGIGAIWVNRTGVSLDARYPAPDAQISDLSPLPDLLARAKSAS